MHMCAIMNAMSSLLVWSSLQFPAWKWWPSACISMSKRQ